MKLGIMNLTSTPIKIGVNSNSTEIISMCNQLNEAGYDCTVLNQTDIKFGLFDTGRFNTINFNNVSANDYDAILLMNSHPNFFGGQRDDVVLDKYKFLAKCEKPIFYLYNDKNLPFEQLWKNIKDRSWNDLTEEDVKITAPIYIISQFFDVQGSLAENNISEGTFVDFGVWRLKNQTPIPNKSTYDLIYGGSFRGGRREKLFKEYFFNRDLNVAIYGTMKLSSFKTLSENDIPPQNWLGKIACDEVIEKNSQGFATIIIGEKNYNNNIHTIRMYESILANTVTFIDNTFDKNHTIYNNDFLYVKDGNDLESKIKLLKSNKDLYNNCMASQHEFINKKRKVNYINDLTNYIKEKINA